MNQILQSQKEKSTLGDSMMSTHTPLEAFSGRNSDNSPNNNGVFNADKYSLATGVIDVKTPEITTAMQLIREKK